jgi:hypothetical protein
VHTALTDATASLPATLGHTDDGEISDCPTDLRRQLSVIDKVRISNPITNELSAQQAETWHQLVSIS